MRETYGEVLEIRADTPERRLMLAVVQQAIRDVVLPGAGVTEANVRDAHLFLSSPERCGEFLQWLDVDAVAFSEHYRRKGPDAFVTAVLGGEAPAARQKNQVRQARVFRRKSLRGLA